MEKKYDADLKFVFRTILVSAALIFALKLFVAPLVMVPDPRAEEIRNYVKEIVPVQASEARGLLVQARGKPAMIFIYASWCAYCKQLWPEITELMRDKQLDGVGLYFFSMDRQFSSLSEFLVRNGYTGLFTPYVIKQSGVNNVEEAFKPLGSEFSGSIPYLAFFNRDGKLVAQSLGFVDKQVLLSYLRQAKS